MSSHQARHDAKAQKAQKRMRRSIFGLFCGAIACILSWIVLTVDIYQHKPLAAAICFAIFMTLIFIAALLGFDKNKKALEKFPGFGKSKALDVAMTKKEKQKAKLAKQKKKGKKY